ncbi:phosphate ABC transporter substrate-binding protein [Burkholderia sp. WAC0059]|uniref:substrate-binding domain-containing protein n=1 Tax=Burkholderia sp. WAC0059 TaxID=2066022 RepID=UPI000C7F7606|nr:substrate-binding domain-containing protein [Burkholderia sp. WAC0059]PLZ01748.1 phosphate ABC transporter substrate-binding protein [Burkholderia sp. WAC0059]
MKLSKRKTCLAVALAISALGAAVPAMAQVVGGGSSLVGPSIQSEISTFGANPDSLTYYVTSSGTGQTAFLNDDATVFSGASAGPVYFANSDAAVASAWITSYNTNDRATDGALIQIPYIVTPITIPYTNGPTSSTDTLKGPQTTPNQSVSLALNDTDLCGIFSGAITNWNKVTNPDTNTTFNVNEPIEVVYRSDSSGTTELLTRHLATVCPAIAGSTTTPSGVTVTFVDSQLFTDSFPNGFPSGASFVPASGSGGVATAIAGTSSATTVSAIGYLSPDYTNTYLAPSSTSAANENLTVASLQNSQLSPVADVAPTYAEATNAVNTGATPSDVTNPADWVPDVANPDTGYPVSGTSNILLSQCYANENVAETVVNFLTDHYTTAAYTSILHGNGFDVVPSGFETLISDNFLTNNSGNNLAIGQGTVVPGCLAHAGR